MRWGPTPDQDLLTPCAVTVLGAFSVLLAGGFLCETLGWPSLFYISGECSLPTSHNWVLWQRGPGSISVPRATCDEPHPDGARVDQVQS